MRTKHIRRVLVVLAIALAGVLAFGAVQAFAADSGANVGSAWKAQQQGGKGGGGGAGKLGGSRVDQAKKRIETAITKLNQFKEKRLSAFAKLDGKMKESADKFAAQGLDVTKLRSDIAALEAKVEGAGQEVDQVIDALKKAEGLASAATLQQFKAAAKDALAKAKAFKQEKQEVRAFGKVIKQDVAALKAQAGQAPAQ